MSRPCFDGFGCGIKLANYYASETLRLFDVPSTRTDLTGGNIPELAAIRSDRDLSLELGHSEVQPKLHSQQGYCGVSSAKQTVRSRQKAGSQMGHPLSMEPWRNPEATFASMRID
jgi:hypothetical protein